MFLAHPVQPHISPTQKFSLTKIFSFKIFYFKSFSSVKFLPKKYFSLTKALSRKSPLPSHLREVSLTQLRPPQKLPTTKVISYTFFSQRVVNQKFKRG